MENETQGAGAVDDGARVIDADPEMILERLDAWLDGFVRLIPNMVIALVLIAVVWVLAIWIGRLIRRSATKRNRDNLGAVVGSFTRWAVVLLGILLALTIVIPSLRPGDLIAGLGVGSVAIGFAFKDILQNWLAGILILIRQPFAIGDEIVVEGFEGTVERIESRATLIRTYDNQRVVIPNSDIYTGAVTVHTAFDQRRNQYDVGIGYSDDIDEACALIVEAVSKIEGVSADPGAEAFPWGLDPSWVTLRVRWWTRPDRRSVVHTTARVLAAVKRALDEAGIDLPYDTQVHLWHDQSEEFDGDRTLQREGWPAPKGKRPPRPARIAKRNNRAADRSAEAGTAQGEE